MGRLKVSVGRISVWLYVLSLSLSFSLTVSIIAFNSFHMNSEMSLLKLPLFQLFCSQKREFSVVEGRYANKLCSMTIFVFQLISMVWKAWEKKKKNSTLIGTTLTTSPQWYNIVYFSYKPAWFYFWFHPKKNPIVIETLSLINISRIFSLSSQSTTLIAYLIILLSNKGPSSLPSNSHLSS